MSSCQVTIDLPNSDMQETIYNIQRYSTPRYENFFEVAFENYGVYINGKTTDDDVHITITGYYINKI